LVTLIQWKSQPAVIPDILSLKGKSGFVFAPFDFSSENPIRLIQPDLVLRGDKFDNIDFEINQILSERSFYESKHHSGFANKPHPIQKVEYMSQVDELRKMIGESPLDKVVLSRVSAENKP
ncbi:MAG: hypothetical protein ABR597_12410, partial [Bacteroidales bacterium]